MFTRNAQHENWNVVLFTAAMAFTNEQCVELLVLILNESLWIRKELDDLLINLDQLRHNNVTT